jgi:class 3 adenylate cyclase/tetratricopeptide (TPR) repeat protein
VLTCASCGRENPDDARFCAGCAAPLAPAEPAREVRKTVTVLFSDVQGSTAMGERLDPESLRRAMGRYFEAMRTVLERHGGTVEKFIGDAVMAVFGIPQLHEDDALRAVRAAAEMQEERERLNEELERDYGVRIESRTGVNTGEVVAGEGETLATGDAVNVAARLEQAAPVGEVLLGEQTYRLVRDAIEVDPVEPLELKGKAERVPAYRLLEVRPHGEGFLRRFDVPMVGRALELEQLRSAYEDARSARAARLVTVVGEPGIGKSRLAEEFVSAVRGEATALAGRCLPYGEGITYWPLVEIVRSAGASLEELTAGAPEADLIRERIAEAVGSGPATASSDEIAWGTRRLFEWIARERPLVVVIDDLQWAEPTFVELLEHVTYLSAAPVLLLGLARPELLETRPGLPGHRLRLAPLSENEAETLIEEFAGTLDEETRTRIASAAEGNPLFVEQMLAMLQENGHGPITVPPTIQALLAARLDRLEPEPRTTIERASVIGQEFWTTALGELSPAGSSIGGAVLELVRQELVRPQQSTLPGEDAFAFVHLLLRDAAYAGVSKDLRADLHERLAGWFERFDAARSTQHEEIVGYHFEQAFRYRTELAPGDRRTEALARAAGERLAAAGRRAYLRGDTPAAVSLLRRAITLLPEEDELRNELLPELAAALFESGELEEAGEALREAVQSGRDEIAAVARLQQLTLQMFSGDSFEPAETRREARAAIEVFERTSDHRGLARAWLLLGELANMVDDRVEMGEAAERAVEHARLSGDHRTEAEAVRLFGGALVYGLTPVPEGIAALEEILSRGVTNQMVEAAVLAPLAALKAMRGDFGDARRLAERARLIYRELGLSYQLARLGFMTGIVESLAGDLEAAERELLAGVQALRDMGEKARMSGMAFQRAQILLELGRLEEVEEMLQLMETTDPEYWSDDPAVKNLRGVLLARQGKPEGEALAVEGAKETPRKGMRAATLENVADVVLRAGRPDEAETLLREALELREQKGDLASAERIRVRLEQLAAEPLAERE